MSLFNGAWPTGPVARIGVMPGSFNPPHTGHAELAKAAMASGELDGLFIYVNSICKRKMGELVPQRHRVALLERLLSEPGLWVISSDFFPENPGSQFLPQEQVFLPLIARLVEALGSNPEVWLVRGSDNFRPTGKGGYSYPTQLRTFPHVIGLRAYEDDDYDYTVLPRKVFVRTRTVSSTQVRQDLCARGGTTALLPTDLASYITAHHLFEPRAEGLASTGEQFGH